ncbi:TIGR01777 family oxidoreductase [Nonomuraea typhae]|uniref:TIGR01777 family oxidoreductase n=1 Tax=Nonomuraea typhae TaxID=2603600 RepID=UPI0012FCE7DC|nr:TIGR01777 family oxidoreductase [Nonomuraea typhae]
MAIIVTGASGLLGPALIAALRERGDDVVRLVRRPPRADDEAQWDPAGGVLDPGVLDGASAVVHLAGAPIAGKRWSQPYKKELVASRVDSAATLVRAIEQAERKPEVLVSASGVDFYGDTGDRVIDEDAPAGTGFLPQLCVAWEGAARQAPVRTVQVRTGLVLSGKGGALQPMFPIFRMGLGAPLGSGRQYWSWIAVDDWVGSVLHILENREIAGPVNLVSPSPVTNAEFTKQFGRALKRPTMPIGVPGFALELGLGEFARAALLPSHRISPKKLTDSGYGFAYTHLDQALAAVI